MTSQNELKKQLKVQMQMPENLVCLDCKDKRPTWASLIVPPDGSEFPTIGCFCCFQCSGAHRRMGTHICFVRSTNLDEWKEKEILAMQLGGNKLINAIFEANLSAAAKGDIKPDNTTEMATRAAFIFDKYQHRKWYNIAAYKVMARQVKPNPNVAQHSSFPLDPELDLFSEANMTANNMDLFSTAATTSADKHGMNGGFVAPASMETFEKEPDSDWWKMNASKKSSEAAQRSKSRDNSSHHDASMKEIHFDPNASAPVATSKSFVPPSPKRTPTSPGAAPSALANLTRTMQRMESKVKLLDELNRMDIDPDAPKPKKIGRSKSSRTHSREKLSKKPSFEAEGSGENRGSNTSRRKLVSRNKSGEGGELLPPSSGRRNSMGRAQSMSSRRKGVVRSNSSEEELNASNSGENSGTDPQSLKQTIGKTSSDDSSKDGEQLEHTSSNSGRSRLPRDPRKGPSRTKSLDTDFKVNEAPPPPRLAPARARSRSVKRRPRRQTSTTSEAYDIPAPGSDLGQFGDSFSSFSKKDDDAAVSNGGRSRTNAPVDDLSSTAGQSRSSRPNSFKRRPRRQTSTTGEAPDIPEPGSDLGQFGDSFSSFPKKDDDAAVSNGGRSRTNAPVDDSSSTAGQSRSSRASEGGTAPRRRQRSGDRRRNEKASMAPLSLTDEVGKLLGLEN